MLEEYFEEEMAVKVLNVRCPPDSQLTNVPIITHVLEAGRLGVGRGRPRLRTAGGVTFRCAFFAVARVHPRPSDPPPCFVFAVLSYRVLF